MSPNSSSCKKCQTSISHEEKQLQLWKFQRCCDAVQQRYYSCVSPWDATVSDPERESQIQNGFRRLKCESISGVTSTIDLKLSEELEHTVKVVLEREVVICCALGSWVMLTQLPFMAIHLALCHQSFTTLSALRNGRYDYNVMCDGVVSCSCFCGVLHLSQEREAVCLCCGGKN